MYSLKDKNTVPQWEILVRSVARQGVSTFFHQGTTGSRWPPVRYDGPGLSMMALASH